MTAGHDAGVVQCERNDSRPPLVVQETAVRFNGVGELGHETFVFDASELNRRPDGFRFDFCKTARKPYDTLVMKVLIVLKYHLGDGLKVTNDGRLDDEWAAVRAEMATRYGMATFADEQLLVCGVTLVPASASLATTRGAGARAARNRNERSIVV